MNVNKSDLIDHKYIGRLEASVECAEIELRIYKRECFKHLREIEELKTKNNSLKSSINYYKKELLNAKENNAKDKITIRRLMEELDNEMRGEGYRKEVNT